MIHQPSNILIVSVGVGFCPEIFPLINESYGLILLTVPYLSAQQLPQQNRQTVVIIVKKLIAHSIVDNEGIGIIDLIDSIAVVAESGVTPKPFKDMAHLNDKCVVESG